MKSEPQISAPGYPSTTETSIFQIHGDLNGPPTESENSEQFIGINLGVEQFYMPLKSVQEIALVPKVTFVPNANPYIDGITNLRGTLIPIINLKKLMGFSLRQRSSKERLLVLREGPIDFAIIVDDVFGMIGLRPNEIDTPPASHGNALVLIPRVSKQGDQIHGILDSARILKQTQGKSRSF